MDAAVLCLMYLYNKILFTNVFALLNHYLEK
jgi:hypothetical protein